MTQEAAEARIGADRMAMGLSCIPDPQRGDMAEVERLQAHSKSMIDALNADIDAKRAEVERLTATLQEIASGCANPIFVARRALEPKP